MPSKRKTESRAKAAKKAQRKNAMDKPSGESRYGKKRKYLVVNGGFGFQYEEPKPWK